MLWWFLERMMLWCGSCTQHAWPYLCISQEHDPISNARSGPANTSTCPPSTCHICLQEWPCTLVTLLAILIQDSSRHPAAVEAAEHTSGAQTPSRPARRQNWPGLWSGISRQVVKYQVGSWLVMACAVSLLLCCAGPSVAQQCKQSSALQWSIWRPGPCCFESTAGRLRCAAAV